MSKRRIISYLIIMMLSIYLIPVTGNNSFAHASSDFSGSTFKDVKNSSWFYNGVKSAYNSGFMNGTGEYFSPNNNFTLVQAITVAARMYAFNKNETINVGDSNIWFEPYVDYAIKNNLINDAVITKNNFNNINATREETAFLFYNVLKSIEANPQSINNSTIPDLNRIPAEYRNAVQSMYKAGIITGMPDGNFTGNAYVTRAQISIIIERIIDKQERVPYDEKYNREMKDQAGNTFMYKGYIAYDDDFTYFSVDTGYGTGESNIVRKNNITGNVEALYVGNGDIYNLRLKNGKLYFVENLNGIYDSNWGGTTAITDNAYLICYDTKSKSASCLYKTNKFVSIYGFELYGDAIYLDITNDTANYDSEIIKLSNQGVESLIEFDNSNLSHRDIFLYNDMLYFNAQSGIGDYNIPEISMYVYNLKTREYKLLLDIGFGGYLMTNGILYVQSSVDNANSSINNIYKYNLATGMDYNKDRKLIFTSDSTKSGIYSCVFSVVEGNIYLGCKNSTSIYKILGDGSLSMFNKVAVDPLNFVLTGWGEFLYLNYWEPNRAQYFTSKYPYFDGLKDYLLLSENDYRSAIGSLADGKTAVVKFEDLTVSNDYKDVIFYWDDPITGKREWSQSINKALYEKYKSIDRLSNFKDYGGYSWYDYAHYVLNSEDDYIINAMAKNFLALKEEQGHTNNQIIQSVANFVQEMKYETDIKGTGYDEYPKYPIEMLYDQNGDCEDKSILLASLLLEMNFDTVMVAFPGHMMVAVACDSIPGGESFSYNGKTYYFVETTSYPWKVGALPEELSVDDIKIFEIK